VGILGIGAFRPFLGGACFRPVLNTPYWPPPDRIDSMMEMRLMG
jgi:hypothetical protein